MFTFKVNGETKKVDVPGDTPLLWVLRETLKLQGTKFGCGKGLCGACTVHFSGEPVRSCQMPVAAVDGKDVVTIEGISANGNHAVQEAWKLLNVPQCGYCQSGQIMSALGLLNQHSNPSDEDIDAAMSGNICRCGTYNRIRKAIKLVAAASSSHERGQNG